MNRLCRARAINTLEGNEENSAFIRLTVDENKDNKEIAPSIIIAPEDTKIVKGTAQTTLECVANGKPLHELETIWYKDGIQIESSGIAYALNDVWNRSLSLISVNTTHSGKYECNINLRSGGFPTVKAVAQVDVLEKPRFFGSSKPETLGEYGLQLSLPCDVVGIPTPNVSWYRNAEPVDLRDKR